MDEFEIIRRFFTSDSASDSVVVGVGDDGAVLRPAPGKDLVSVIDTMVAGVHFPDTLPSADIGFRAVAINISDIAAMGAVPRWMTMALTLDEAQPDWLDGFAEGVRDASRQYGVELVGGDITRGSDKVISVQVTGEVDPGSVLTRSGAQSGDGIYVSGTPGDAALGLSIIESGARAGDAVDYLVRRFSRPDARVALGSALAGRASAAIDLSDGLYADLVKLLDASGVAGRIRLDDLPASTELAGMVSREDALAFMLGGGDDYELAFTSADESIIRLAGDVAVTRIGSVVEGEGLSCTLDGEPYKFDGQGYRHFH
jgi:thiamine-monophosphate kinase